MSVRRVELVKLRGDSLWSISRRYGVSIDNLTRWNRIPKNALLHPGQSLVVGR